MIVQRAFSGLLTGTVFGIGLAVSQMTNPEKVLSFLTLNPEWDPSLLLVLGAAVTVTWLGYRWILNGRPLFDTEHHLSENRTIDGRLLVGAIAFGTGWGIAGYCPGPALAGLGSGSSEPQIFILSMIAGSQIAKLTTR